jgi:hypothetical protein
MKLLISTIAGFALVMMPTCLAAQNNPDPPAAQNDAGPPPSEKNPQTFNHGEIEAFADYFRFTQSSTPINFTGVGARVGFNANPNLALEANMSYDFSQNYTSSSSSGATTSFARTTLRPLTGLFGPKFQFGTSGPVRAFLTGKVGFVNFSTTSRPINGTSFTGSINNVTGPGTFFSVYPGAGVEFFGGPIGFRIDVGDLMYLNNGVNNNLKISGGPAIRF